MTASPKCAIAKTALNIPTRTLNRLIQAIRRFVPLVVCIVWSLTLDASPRISILKYQFTLCRAAVMASPHARQNSSNFFDDTNCLVTSVRAEIGAPSDVVVTQYGSYEE